MMMPDGPPTPQQLGVWHHVCAGTLDMQSVYKAVVGRGYKPPREPNLARDCRMLLQLYDQAPHADRGHDPQARAKSRCPENMDPYIK